MLIPLLHQDALPHAHSFEFSPALAAIGLVVAVTAIAVIAVLRRYKA